eukprot:1046281-Pleurochrysis_carterae.AAC.3
MFQPAYRNCHLDRSATHKKPEGSDSRHHHVDRFGAGRARPAHKIPRLADLGDYDADIRVHSRQYQRSALASGPSPEYSAQRLGRYPVSHCTECVVAGRTRWRCKGVPDH